jgi:hypothetical protein
MSQTARNEVEGPPIVVRCFGCRNRFGLAALVVLEVGVLCCRRCAGRQQLVVAPRTELTIVVIG